MTSTPSSDPQDAKTTIATQRIEALFTSIIAALRAHDFNSTTWSQYLDVPTFTSQNSFGPPTSFHEWLSGMADMAAKHPSWTSDVLDFQTSVDVEQGVGTVLANIEVRNIPVGIVRKTVQVSEFRRLGGVWRMVGHSRFQGWEAGAAGEGDGF